MRDLNPLPEWKINPARKKVFFYLALFDISWYMLNHKKGVMQQWQRQRKRPRRKRSKPQTFCKKGLDAFRVLSFFLSRCFSRQFTATIDGEK